MSATAAAKGRICFVVPSLNLGGQENAAAVMSNFFAARGFEVAILTIFNLPRFHQVDERIRVIDPPYDKSRGGKLGYYLKIMFFLRKKLKSLSPLRIISYGDWSNILVIAACIRLPVNVFISDRASPDTQFQWYVRKLRNLLYPRAFGIIAQTEKAAGQKRKMLGDGMNIRVLPNPVKPVELFPEVRRQNIVLGVGRHWHVKGLDRLLEAFALVDRRDYRLMIAGSTGPVTRDLEEIVQEYRLQDSVRFLGRVEDMDRLYAHSKIFVLPSRNEGFPNALIESMAAGLACISFNCSAGPDEIISHGEDGILVEEGNIEELAGQIQHLMDHEAERIRLGENALKIRERLSLETVGNQFIAYVMNS